MKSVANVFLMLSLLIGLSVSSILAAPDDATPAKSSSITIGQFAIAVAKAMDYAPETQATLSTEAALATLKESGWSFSGGSDAVLTQAEFAAFLRQAGVQVSVPSPEQPVSLQQAKTALSGFGSLFASKGASEKLPPVVGHINTHDPLPESFADCAALPKVPDCRACCLNLGVSSKSCGKACGRAHAAINVSATGPTP
jgi:hypothetical protein